MIFIESTQFKKDFKKLSEIQKERVFYTIDIFIKNPHDPKLKNHKLKGKLSHCFSLKADYDLRIVCEYKDNKIYVVLVSVGKHDDVY